MKYISGICICLLFSASAFAQEQEEPAPTQEPSQSVIDKDLTVNAEQEVGTVDPNATQEVETPSSVVDPLSVDAVIGDQAMNQHYAPMQQTAPIQTMVQQPGCGCQQTNYQAAMPTMNQTYAAQPYSNQVYSGNTFTQAPMQGQQVYQNFAVPQQGSYTSFVPQAAPQVQTWQYQQQYRYAPQQFVPVRRGPLFYRFRR